MAKDPAVLLYTSDFLSGCQDLTMYERGQFITLLCLQHQKGYLTDKIIKLTCAEVSEDVLERFERDEKGNLFNKRMALEIQKRKSNSEKQSKRSRDYWAKKKLNDQKQTNNKPTGYPTGKPLENENENENVNTIKNVKIVYPFETFEFKASWNIWKQYRKDIKKPYKSKISEQGALKRLSDMASNCNEAIEIIEYSIAQAYQGLWKENKTTHNGRKNNNNAEQYSDLESEILRNLQSTGMDG